MRYIYKILYAIKMFCPPVLWLIVNKLVGRKCDNSIYSKIEYQGVITQHNMFEMHEGKFASINHKYYSLDPNHEENVTRLRHYYICLFATFAKHIKGDFLFAGISYGVAPRVVYDFTNFGTLNKNFYLVDSFSGEDDGGLNESYNTSTDFVKKQYPNTASIFIHKESIPDYFVGLEGGGELILCSS